ncbi:DEP domain-containing protein 7-like [Apostichopus japonicus]|uniref:DEP domain-containing protein 7-like n=1 Tax=Stichopus japonicus TaxID=307972 RepID=UPI003AB2D4AC
MATLIGMRQLAGNCNRCTGGPFKATNLWNNIIIYLKENVDVRTRKHRMKTFEHCFLGSDAVDVVLGYLKQDEHIRQSITREKVTKLCTHFLESNVFLDAESGPSTKGHFEDNPTHYYRFHSQVTNSCSSSECQCKSKDGGSSDKPFQRLKKRRSFGKGKSMKLEFGPYQKPANKQGVLLTETPMLGLSSSAVLEGIFASEIPKSSPVLRRSSRILSSFRRSKPPSKTENRIDEGISAEEKDEIWQEIIVQRLLHLMDIPVLENILSCSLHCFYGQNFSESIAGDLSADIQEDYRGSILDGDPWIKAAIRCIEDEMEVITIISHCHARAQELDSPDLAYKLYLFKYICEIYSAERGPLIPPQLLDVVSAILGALANGKTSRAIELCQICLLLVGNQARDKIQRLLEFMVIASDSRQIRLEVKTDNRTTILNLFRPALVNSPLLSNTQCLNLVSFWLDCHSKVLKVPLSVQRHAKDKIDAAEMGLENQTTVTFCQKMSKSDYNQQMNISTQKALKDLTNHIIDDTATSLKEKKQHLKGLQKHHSDVYNQYFPDMV